jgi:hypothetical protein
VENEMNKNPLHSRESNEWYTPKAWANLSRQVMDGPIDLDPASCEEANRYIGAAHILTREDDGLSKPWIAERVFVNPPGGVKADKEKGIEGEPGGAGLWLPKFMSEYHAGNFEQGIFLFFRIGVETEWFHSVLGKHPIAVLANRIPFIKPEAFQTKKKNQPSHGNAFLYVGEREHEFTKVFGEYGIVIPPFRRK